MLNLLSTMGIIAHNAAVVNSFFEIFQKESDFFAAHAVDRHYAVNINTNDAKICPTAKEFSTEISPTPYCIHRASKRDKRREKQKSACNASAFLWRKEWDSNPRCATNAHTISNRAP